MINLNIESNMHKLRKLDNEGNLKIFFFNTGRVSGRGGGDFEWRPKKKKKEKKKKSLRLPNKTPKISLDQKLTPAISHAEFPCLKTFQKGLNNRFDERDAM